LLVHTKHLNYAARVAHECPGLRLVVDHLAKPPIANGEIDEWRREVGKLAAYENVWCKLSGLVTEADHDHWRVSDLRPYVETAFQFFRGRKNDVWQRLAGLFARGFLRSGPRNGGVTGYGIQCGRSRPNFFAERG
jgi:predicted TIM-barrel fold metal-dependent hydrolase